MSSLLFSCCLNTFLQVNQKKKRGKRSREKKRQYDKQKKQGTQAANQKLRKKKKRQEKPKAPDMMSKNARRKMIRNQAFGVEVTGAEQVLDKRFEEESEEQLVRDLQMKVQKILEQDGTAVQVVPDSAKVPFSILLSRLSQ